VYFFFRETAVEYINCGKAVYSRIARVCKKDVGGKNLLAHNWATYLKARLNCSISGEFPFYFNEIQSVYQLPSDKSRFFATFTTSTNGLIGSAVCSFHINEIQAAFNGKPIRLLGAIRTSHRVDMQFSPLVHCPPSGLGGTDLELESKMEMAPHATYWQILFAIYTVFYPFERDPDPSTPTGCLSVL